MDIIKRSPAESCILPKSQRKEESLLYMEKEELQAFLSAAKRHPLYYELFRFLAYTGCRIGEALALTWSDIEGNSVSINKSLSVLSSPYIKGAFVNPTKTQSSHRTIYIDDETLAIILRLKTLQAAFKLKNNKFTTDNVFVTQRGLPPLSTAVNKKFKLILVEAGINKPLSTHKLRHTHTSILAAAGIPLEEIRKRLGHSKDVVTLQIYYHVTKDRKTAAADVFAKYMKM